MRAMGSRYLRQSPTGTKYALSAKPLFSIEPYWRYGLGGNDKKMTETALCPFCSFPRDKVVARNSHGFALHDGFPVSPGHTLVVPNLHVANLFELPPEAILDLWRLAAEVRETLKRDFRPDGFNIGVNDGRAAGQTIMHAHIHVIPRFNGDVADPGGGIRWVVPAKARYWRKS